MPDKPTSNPPAENPDEMAQDATTPAEERGERIETGRQIARGGHRDGTVPGATGDEPDDPRSGKA